MNHPPIWMLHVVFGTICLGAALWVFVDTLNVTEKNVGRIRKVSGLVAISMWTSYGIAGYWYVTEYARDQAIIQNGPWPFAHNFFMETKEHLVITLLLLSTYLPIAAASHLASSAATRNIVLLTSGLVLAFGIIADGFGGIVATGVRVALAAR